MPEVIKKPIYICGNCTSPMRPRNLLKSKCSACKKTSKPLVAVINVYITPYQLKQISIQKQSRIV